MRPPPSLFPAGACRGRAVSNTNFSEDSTGTSLILGSRVLIYLLRALWLEVSYGKRAPRMPPLQRRPPRPGTWLMHQERSTQRTRDDTRQQERAANVLADAIDKTRGEYPTDRSRQRKNRFSERRQRGSPPSCPPPWLTDKSRGRPFKAPIEPEALRIRAAGPGRCRGGYRNGGNRRNRHTGRIGPGSRAAPWPAGRNTPGAALADPGSRSPA